jgi:ribosome-associated protein
VKKAPAKKPVSKPAAKPAKKPVKTVARKAAAPKAALPKAVPQSDLLKRILVSLDDDKAENIVTIDLEGRSSLCDAAVIASGRSSRHVAAMADHLARKLKEGGYGTRPVSGQGQGDWVLVDAGDVIVHLFRPEVRDYYDLEGMWSVGSRK